MDICKFCGKKYNRAYSEAGLYVSYCCKKCEKVDCRKCKWCESAYSAKERHNSKYCSQECVNAAIMAGEIVWIERGCELCETDIFPKERKNSIYYSQECEDLAKGVRK